METSFLPRDVCRSETSTEEGMEGLREELSRRWMSEGLRPLVSRPRLARASRSSCLFIFLQSSKELWWEPMETERGEAAEAGEDEEDAMEASKGRGLRGER